MFGLANRNITGARKSTRYNKAFWCGVKFWRHREILSCRNFTITPTEKKALSKVDSLGISKKIAGVLLSQNAGQKPKPKRTSTVEALSSQGRRTELAEARKHAAVVPLIIAVPVHGTTIADCHFSTQYMLYTRFSPFCQPATHAILWPNLICHF